jgi:glucose/arabinose dehydrogenase
VTIEPLEPRMLLAASTGPTLPPGFQYEKYVPLTTLVTSMTFAPDGRLFYTEKGSGKVRVVKNGVTQPTPVITVPVSGTAEGGLECIELDPNFETNGYFYLFSTRGSSPAGGPSQGAVNRVSRYKIDPAHPDQALANSETVLVDGIVSTTGIHNAGAMHFGADGMLYICTGEGSGESVQQSNGAAQDLSNLSGKVLRINPNAYPNIIPSDNPFVGQSGKRPEIWAYGFRNPFTAAIFPGTNELLVNDVGSYRFEEIDEIEKGKNYGWPIAGDGPTTKPGISNPIYSYPHSDSLDGKSAAITGGVFYVGTNFPQSYNGQYFFGDYVNKRIRVLDPETGKATPFASGVSGPLDLDVGPDGALYSLAPFGNGIFRISFVGSGNRAPIAAASADATSGALPLAVHFDGSLSTDADKNSLTYTWDFGDGSTGTGVKPTHVYTSAGAFSVVMTANDGHGGTDASDPIVIHAGDKAPIVTILTPKAGAVYKSGQTFSFSGIATDPEDGALPASAYHWQIVFHHEMHTHPFLDNIDGVTSGTFTIPLQGEADPVQWYRIHLVVTDSAGASTEQILDIHPRISHFTLATNVKGLAVNLDSQPLPAIPAPITGVVGQQRLLSAPPTQKLKGHTYKFVKWSDGGKIAHLINSPASNTTYTAVYKRIN